MSHVIRTESYKRGFFGWIFKVLFIIYNAAMALWLISYWVQISKLTTASDAERTDAAIGGGIGTGVILFMWVMGAVILGLLTYFSRGRKIVIEKTITPV